jgi:hypothetical protein
VVAVMENTVLLRVDGSSEGALVAPGYLASLPAPVLSNEEVEGWAMIYRSSEALHLMSFENFLRVALIVRRHHAS